MTWLVAVKSLAAVAMLVYWNHNRRLLRELARTLDVEPRDREALG